MLEEPALSRRVDAERGKSFHVSSRVASLGNTLTFAVAVAPLPRSTTEVGPASPGTWAS